jgi:XTP/dITP diphosphohydrolase
MARSAPQNPKQQTPTRNRRTPLLLATGNQGKIQELAHLLSPFHDNLLTLKDVGLTDDVVESGATLEHNAALKAKNYSRRSGLWAVADDSGLEVDALGGAPGPFSKRYAGSGASDDQLIRYLLKQMDLVSASSRSARFRCVIALASPDGYLSLFQGSCTGTITIEPRGAGGFGYDSIFLLPQLRLTMAELSLEEKNRVSHRSKAVLALTRGLMRTRGLVEG